MLSILERIEQGVDEADRDGEPVEGAGPCYPFSLRRPARSVARDHLPGHHHRPLAPFAQPAGCDTHNDIEDGLVGQPRLPIGHLLQERVAPPQAEERGGGGGTGLWLSQGDDLSHGSGALPLWETQPDGVAVLVQAQSGNERLLPFTFQAALAIALPEPDHRVQAFFLLFRPESGKGAAIGWVLCLHLCLRSWLLWPIGQAVSFVVVNGVDAQPEVNVVILKRFFWQVYKKLFEGCQRRCEPLLDICTRPILEAFDYLSINLIHIVYHRDLVAAQDLERPLHR